MVKVARRSLFGLAAGAGAALAGVSRQAADAGARREFATGRVLPFQFTGDDAAGLDPVYLARQAARMHIANTERAQEARRRRLARCKSVSAAFVEAHEVSHQALMQSLYDAMGKLTS